MHTQFHGRIVFFFKKKLKAGCRVISCFKRRVFPRLALESQNMSHATRRRTANVPVAAPVAAPVTAAASLARPSGRFDALVDMGNPMKGINLFPYLRRRVEGRALGAIGPAAVLELSRTVREPARHRRWPREVFCVFFSFFCALFDQIVFLFSRSHHVSCKGSGSAPSDRRVINSSNSNTRVTWR